MNEERLRQNLESVRARIAVAARRSGREASTVTLVAVTKKTPSDWARALCAHGAADLGENYPQELWAKVEALSDLPVRWHLIGHLQSNKARRTFEMVRMVHAVDSLRLLRTLDTLATDMPAPPGVCLQVNTSGEPAKHGWSPDAIASEAEAIAACRSIPVVGLMTMAALGTDAASARPMFAWLRRLRDDLRARTGLSLDALSMGMSGDFESAVEEGATHVRVGSALFEGVGP
jgi:pyridoxal phosphate enzyme (YggS family)